MRKYLLIISLAISGFGITGVPASADETHFDIHIDSRGISEDIIRLKEHAYEMEKEERQRVEAKLKQLSVESLEVGDLYLEKGEVYPAIDYYRQAIYLNGANTEAHQQLIKARRMRDAYEKRIGAHYHRAMNYYRRGLTEQAVGELVEAIKQDPDNDAARIRLNEIENLRD